MAELLPCRKCGSTDIDEDYSGTIPTYDGSRDAPTDWHEYQIGWVECNDCGHRIEIQIDHQHDRWDLSQAVHLKWNGH